MAGPRTLVFVSKKKWNKTIGRKRWENKNVIDPGLIEIVRAGGHEMNSHIQVNFIVVDAVVVVMIVVVNDVVVFDILT